jgi:hypothetical protein
MIDTGGEHLATVEKIGSYTNNVSPILGTVLLGPYPGGGRYMGEGKAELRGGLPGLSGLRCFDVEPKLATAIAMMHEEKQRLIALEPEGGWGSYSGSLVYLKAIQEACHRHPKAILAVSW